MTRLLYILTLLLLLSSCAISEVDMPRPSEPEAVETDSLGSFELTLTGARQTRATQTSITKEQADNFLITIYKGDDLYRATALLKDVNKNLSAGYGYTIQAENCTADDAESQPTIWGQRRYSGVSAPFAIKAGQTTAVGVSCSVANAGVEVVFDKTVSDFFSQGYSVSITEGSRTITFDAETGGRSENGTLTRESQIAYFNVGTDGIRHITYHIHAVSPRKTLDRDIELTLTKAKVERVKVYYEMSTFSFDITIDEEEIFLNEEVFISDDDIKMDDGVTDTNATHDTYTEDNTDVDINNYGD